MKRFLLLNAFAFIFASLFSQGLIISEIVDGTGSGGYPKYVEITNTSGLGINLMGYTVNIYTNGGETPYRHYEFSTDFILPSKASVVLTNIDNVTGGQKWSDFNLNTPAYAIYGVTVAYGNGDDVYELQDPVGNSVDVYGDIGDDFTGEDWEYTDSYSYRKPTIHSPTGNFDPMQWYCAGRDALDGHSSDLSPYLTPGTHVLASSVGTLSFVSPAGGEDIKTEEVVTVKWTASDVNYLYLQGKGINETEFENITDSIDATLGTYDIQVPGDAEEGDYQLRVISTLDPNVADTSGVFHITDVTFAGLYDEGSPFYPENGAVDVPTGLDNNRLFIYFKEPVQPGTGYAYLKKLSDNSVVKTFDASDPSQVFVHPVYEVGIVFDVGMALEANTGYYVEIGQGVIIDKAPALNEYPGFTGSTVWSFTTEKATMVKAVKSGDVSVWPNPVTDELRISSAQTISRIQILNVVGRTVLDEGVMSDKVELSIRDVPAGLYVIKISFADGTVKTQKLLKR